MSWAPSGSISASIENSVFALKFPTILRTMMRPLQLLNSSQGKIFTFHLPMQEIEEKTMLGLK